MTPGEELEALRRLAELEAANRPEPGGVGGFAKESAGSVGRGFGNAAITALSMLPIFQLAGASPGLREAGRKMMDRNLPEQEGVYHRMLEGAGAGAPFGPAGMLSGAAGSGASDVTGRFLANQSPMVRKLGEIAAGLTVGGLTGAGLGRLGQPRPGSPTDDLGRDTRILTDIGLNRAGPRTSPQTQANAVEDAATAYFKDARANRTGMFEAQVAGETVSRRELANIYLAARTAARDIAKTGRGEQADAMMEAAERLLTGDKRTFISDLQQLSLSLKNLKENPPALSASTGRQISSKDVADSVKALETALENVSPAFKSANTVYGTASRMIDTASSGPLGRLADKTPYNADPAALGKVEAVIGGSSPGEITQTIAALRTQGADPAAIARALMEKRLAAGPVTPGNAAFGAAGSGKEASLSTLLTAGGRDPAAVRAPLDIADRLSRVAGLPEPIKEFGTVGPTGIHLRAMTKPGFLKGNPDKAIANEEIARLLSSASPAERDLILQLSKYDPKVRLYMALSGMAVPAMSSEVK